MASSSFTGIPHWAKDGRSKTERILAMIQNANLVVTAWDEDQIVGISRAVWDFSFVTYLSDLAIRKSHQKKGIGRELIRQTQIAGGPKTLLVLLSAPAEANRATDAQRATPIERSRTKCADDGAPLF